MENTTKPAAIAAIARLSKASHELFMASSEITFVDSHIDKRIALKNRLERLQMEIEAISKKVNRL